jgi:hypothetical protein
MKKSVLLFSIVLLIGLQLVLAEDNLTESQKINNAYTCLGNEITERGCADLTIQEKIFSVLSMNKCGSELNSDLINNECWGEGTCDIKTTAQAILAVGGNSNAEEWILSNNKTASGMNWYLQIDSNEETICTIESQGASSSFTVMEDKKISSSPGACFSLAQDDYWLRVSPNCYGEDFKISCDKGFIVASIFKKEGSETIHVTRDSKSGSAGGNVNVQIKSSCLGTNSNCNYEETLWAATVLDKEGIDVSSYLPYIMTFAEENSELLPEAFIYSLTGYADAKSELLEKQKAGYWDESGDKLYDTAVALLPFQNTALEKKTLSKEWILNSQDSEGCLEGNLMNSAFALYSIFPRTFGGGDTTDDCEDSGYACLSRASCTGEVLSAYDCSAGLSICCSEAKEEKTCSELAGTICNSNQNCGGGTLDDASDTQLGESCCISGTCTEIEDSPSEEFTCSSNGGTCEISSCSGDQVEDTFYTCEYGDICCIDSSDKGEKSSSLLIWILLALIILIVVGIYFKDKLRVYFEQIGSKFGKKGPNPTIGPGPGGPRNFPTTRMPLRQPRPPMQERKIIPRQAPPQSKSQSPAQRMPLPKKSSNDMDDVLRKLKEMGK